jgi:hypothetical protein
MPKKNPPDPKEKPQRQRFEEFAREHGATDPKPLGRVFPKVAKQPKGDT